MRTRRSPRNQARLWRELGAAPVPPVAPTPPPRSDAEIDAMWWLPTRSRTLLKRDAAKARMKESR
jgi:hypothetical protein